MQIELNLNPTRKYILEGHYLSVFLIFHRKCFVLYQIDDILFEDLFLLLNEE